MERTTQGLVGHCKGKYLERSLDLNRVIAFLAKVTAWRRLLVTTVNFYIQIPGDIIKRLSSVRFVLGLLVCDGWDKSWSFLSSLLFFYEQRVISHQ